MIPTASSAARAIYCEIGNKPADTFYCPNAIPALSAGFELINVHSSLRDKYAPPTWRPFDAPHMSKRGGALQRCNACSRAAPKRMRGRRGNDKHCAVNITARM
jgi:hypothetical protein